ncbi:hypothetical protein [Huaxiibacter chinensis]|uniref:hypothetical protein n=1 Tax=Huaxiibacter chinensis TaxID=2899785 RepID=UPI003D317F92
MDYFFIAWRSKNSDEESIFGSLIYRTEDGSDPIKALAEATAVAVHESGIAYADIRITAFNRV